MDRMMRCVFEEHRLVLSSYVLGELAFVVERKFPTKTRAIDAFLSGISFELVYTPKEIPPGLFDIRDGKDYPVLYTAVMEDVDILITGDKDFSEVNIDRPIIMTPTEFLLRYCGR